MFFHYLKIAARALLEHRGHSLVAILGLAAGFACFSLSALWTRHEMTYDRFHRDPDRLLAIATPTVYATAGFSRINPYPLAAYLQETFPEVEGACSVNLNTDPLLKVDSARVPANLLAIDSSFLALFDVKIIEGDPGFTIQGSDKIAITAGKARQLFGDSSPLGRVVSIDGEKVTIGAVVTGYSRHTNYPFDFLQPIWVPNEGFSVSFCHTLARLLPGVDVEAFTAKLLEHEIKEEGRSIKQPRAFPLHTLRYRDPGIQREVKFHHVLLFSLAGALVILCALVNYLILFASRLRGRSRELALRVACGATSGSLFMLLLAELLLILLAATVAGLFLVFLARDLFVRLSGIELDVALHGEILLYTGAIILPVLALFGIFLAIARRETLQARLRGRRGVLVRLLPVGVQLVVGTGLLFCSAVMFRQVYFLRFTDLGFDHENAASLTVHQRGFPADRFCHQLLQMPLVTGAVDVMQPLMPEVMRSASSVDTWDDKPADAPGVHVYHVDVSLPYLDFYAPRLVAGEMLEERDPRTTVLLNESAAKAFGWNDATGKRFERFTVKGVIRDMHAHSPTLPPLPRNPPSTGWRSHPRATDLSSFATSPGRGRSAGGASSNSSRGKDGKGTACTKPASCTTTSSSRRTPS